MNRIALLSLASLAACKTAAPAQSPAHTAEAVTAPPPEAPYTGKVGGFQAGWIDKSVNPCDDFYQFACGSWIKQNPIPNDHSSWGSFNVLAEKNLDRLRELLEADAAGKGDPADPYTQKLGDYYATCMDEAKIETSADAQLAPELKALDSVKNAASLEKAIAKLHAEGVHPLFGFGSTQDFKDATQVIGDLDQGGLGLPDRDYYLKDDAATKKVQAAYLEHVEAMFKLAGESEKQAKADTTAVYAFEKELAQASQDRVFRRDPKNVYHRLNLDGLEKSAPGFDWAAYLKDLGHGGITAINVDAPEFVVKVAEVAKKAKPETLRAYLRWNVIADAAPHLSKKFVDENFKFTAALTGQKEIRARWKRCVGSTEGALGMALGQAFVRKYYGAEGKAKSQEQIAAIETAMKKDLETLSWMDDATRKEALTKLGKVFNKIGYPDNARNYDSMTIGRDSYLENSLAAARYATERDLNKIGKPLDRTDWDMTPPTVNAYYNPSLNEMVFPAGILQPPFFDKDASDDVNFGAIGVVMGHELTHGFDDEGAQFDGDGNLRKWFGDAALKEFSAKGECVAKQFDGYTVVDDVKVNGHLTEGENIADLGGVRLALAAARAARDGKHVPDAGGFTPDQQVFLGFAQVWCSADRLELKRLLAQVDPHSPAEWRVDGPLSNTPDFAEAFKCAAGSKMVRAPADRCQIW